MSSEDSSEHPAVDREMVGQIGENMERQIKKIFDRLDELNREMNYQFKLIERYLEGMEIRIEEINVQVNMLGAKQTAA